MKEQRIWSLDCVLHYITGKLNIAHFPVKKFAVQALIAVIALVFSFAFELFLLLFTDNVSFIIPDFENEMNLLTYSFHDGANFYNATLSDEPIQTIYLEFDGYDKATVRVFRDNEEESLVKATWQRNKRMVVELEEEVSSCEISIKVSANSKISSLHFSSDSLILGTDRTINGWRIIIWFVAFYCVLFYAAKRKGDRLISGRSFHFFDTLRGGVLFGNL